MSTMSNLAAMTPRERFAEGAADAYAYGCIYGPGRARRAIRRQAVPVGAAYAAGWVSELVRAATRRRLGR